MAKAKGNGGSLRLYSSYNFVDKDPVIDKVRTIIKREGMKNGEVASLSGVSATTLHNWFEGKTRRPQYATIMAVVSSMGYRSVFVKKGNRDV